MAGSIVASISLLVAVLLPILSMAALLQAHAFIDTSEPLVEPAKAALERTWFIGGAGTLLLVGLGLAAVDVPWRLRWVPVAVGFVVGTLLATGYDGSFRAYGDDTNAVQGMWGFTVLMALAAVGVGIALAFRRLVGMAASWALSAGAAVAIGAAGAATLLMEDLEAEAERAAMDNAPDTVQAPGFERIGALVVLAILALRTRRPRMPT